MGVVGSRSRGSSVSRDGRVLLDLEALCDGPGLVLRLGQGGASVSLKSGKTLIFRRTGGRAWKRTTRVMRAKTLASWIRDAASVATARFVIPRVAS